MNHKARDEIKTPDSIQRPGSIEDPRKKSTTEIEDRPQGSRHDPRIDVRLTDVMLA
jgi:hypothetical protein